MKKLQSIGGKKNRGEIVIYKTAQGPDVKVRLEEETVWLTQKQISGLFGKGIPTINEHIGNIYKSGELDKESTVRKFRIVQIEGKRTIERLIDLYNLDMVLSVGYRVNSRQATQFRIWATKTLKSYIVKGYAINEKRLLEAREKLKELQGAISFLQEKSGHELLVGQTREILDILSGYSKTLSILEQYDAGRIPKVKGRKTIFALDYSACRKIVVELKQELAKKGEGSDLFGSERDGSFAGVARSIYQTFGGKELYPNIEDKAAHLLYFAIKDHPFSDGNKRIGSFLFIYFLDRNNYLYRETGERKINDNALVALALLVAVSDPKDKEIIVGIIKNLLS